MNNRCVRPLIGATFFLIGIALIPALLRSVSILISEASPLQIGVWLVLAVSFAFWQWKFTEAMVAFFPHAKRATLKLIGRLRR